MEGEKIQKLISQSGHCSRRRAEILISERRVKINGKVAETGQRATFEDKIEVNGKRIRKVKDHLYIKFNKPRGYVCTNAEYKDEKNIFKLINLRQKLIIVGRLDKESQGLIILTTDGEYANKITHPRYDHKKTYIVDVDNSVFPKKIIESFSGGIKVEDERYTVDSINHIGAHKFKIVLHQGKKRQIRKMFEALNIKVLKLKRIKIGKIDIGTLPEGKWEKIKLD